MQCSRLLALLGLPWGATACTQHGNPRAPDALASTPSTVPGGTQMVESLFQAERLREHGLQLEEPVGSG